jgi:hypothetical protein
MGPQGNDPVCPCSMRNLGLQPTNLWTEESKEKLNKALTEIFSWENKDGTTK